MNLQFLLILLFIQTVNRNFIGRSPRNTDRNLLENKHSFSFAENLEDLFDLMFREVNLREEFLSNFGKRSARAFLILQQLQSYFLKGWILLYELTTWNFFVFS